ncbi:universal stress protein [Kineosporia sp. J2-2]|uniref:Universal stress protein n=1 Tax=Kineosporia corallincola TaxID=2835133 RepID=A0ABS5TPP1_9ACTN|nr:universal stress protein [Kineosporia corallincola]MBT0771564.1 universal stress protein [Kineosporia corallincola]
MNSWLTDPAAFELGCDGPSSIVVAVGCSQTSGRVLAYAAGVARRQNSRLLAVHVRRPMGAGASWTASAGADAYALAAGALAECQQGLEAEIREEIRQLSVTWGVPIQFCVRTGDPLREIARTAELAHADAIIVGAPGTRIRGRLGGSFGARLMDRCGWPVTVVP